MVNTNTHKRMDEYTFQKYNQEGSVGSVRIKWGPPIKARFIYKVKKQWLKIHKNTGKTLLMSLNTEKFKMSGKKLIQSLR